MRLLCLVVLSWLSWPTLAAADSVNALDLLDAPVAYTADFTVSSAKGTYRGQVWHKPGRERRDVQTAKGGQTLLIRRDQDGAWLLKPSGRWYVGLALGAVGQLAGGVDQLRVQRTRTGEGMVAGHKTIRYRINGQAPDGRRFDGDAWFTKEGVMVRARGTLVGRDGRQDPVETELSSLRIGRVDDRVFDLPKGWMGMDLRKVPADSIASAIESLRPLLEGR